MLVKSRVLVYISMVYDHIWGMQKPHFVDAEEKQTGWFALNLHYPPLRCWLVLAPIASNNNYLRRNCGKAKLPIFASHGATFRKYHV